MHPSSSSRNCRYQQPHLPDDCWESVFKHLNDLIDHESLSLVSRNFLSLTNRTHLAVSDRLLPHFPALLCRFPNLTTIEITRYFTGNINALLSQIASFDLPLLHSLDFSQQRTFPSNGLRQFSQKFPTLKSLNCSRMRQDLGLIAECFPNLEELDVSYPRFNMASPGVKLHVMTLGLKKLRKLNISSFHSSIISLCQNCVFLEELVSLHAGYNIQDFANAIRKRPKLKSLAVNRLSDGFMNGFIDALVNLKHLTCLDLFYLHVSDEALCAVAKEELPLRKLSLGHCKGYGYSGFSCLLRKCNNLHYLDLECTEFLNDECVVELALLLGNLNFVKLIENAKLTDLSLFVITRNCPLITDIRMENTALGSRRWKRIVWL